MRNIRRLALAALAVAAGGLGAAQPASALTIGPPVPPNESLPFTIDAGTARFEAIAPDPAGGLPWITVSYLATPKNDPSRVNAIVCTVPGRSVLGKVGVLSTSGEFRAYTPGAGPIACGGPRPGFEAERAGGGALARQPAVQSDPPCAFDCPADVMRVVHHGIAGHGVYAAWSEQPDGSWRRIPIGPRGSYLAVERAPASGTVRLRATLCGPFARPDLKTFPGAVVDGCTVTYTFPPSFPGMP